MTRTMRTVILVLVTLLAVAPSRRSAGAQSQAVGAVMGRVMQAGGEALPGARVTISRLGRRTQAGVGGSFRLDGLAPGAYVLEVAAPGFGAATRRVQVAAGRTTEITITLQSEPLALGEVLVRGDAVPGSVRTIPDRVGTLVLAGAKGEVLQITGMDANLAEKTGRQVFARVPGVFVYDMDGAGNQINISTRGLDPHRSWELNVRQDGVLVNSDMYGYPASHYSPPLEAIERIELVRGTAALQYGSQFGGLVNYVTRQPDTTQAASVESRNSAGSFGLRNTYNAVGGKLGSVTYQGYLAVRRSGGFRRDARSDYSAQYLGATVPLTPTLTLRAQLGRSTYLHRIPGPLTDSMFRADPRASTRSRNWFSPDIMVPALRLEWRPRPATTVTTQLSAVLGVRNSVQFIGFADRADVRNAATGEFAPRQVDIDRFRSYVAETRLTHEYAVAGMPSVLAAGVAFGSNDLHRRQQGRGTTGSGYDLALSSGTFGRDIHYRTLSAAAYLENMVRPTTRWAVIPGVRVERGRTEMTGRLAYYDPADVPTTIKHDFPLFGVRTEYRLARGAELYGGWSQAYRPMVLKDVLPESPIERTDPGLKDARGWTLEAGVRGALRGRLTYDVSAFGLRYGNRFGAVLRSDGAAAPYLFKTNVGSSLTRGVEVALDAPLVITSRLAVNAFTATSFFDARYRAGSVVADGRNVSIEGNRVEGVPRWISRSGLALRGGRFSATGMMSRVSESFADALNTREPTPNGALGAVPAYTVVDVSGSFEALRWLRVRGGISNLLDERYFTKRPSFYPGPGIWTSDGRGVQFSAELTF